MARAVGRIYPGKASEPVKWWKVNAPTGLQKRPREDLSKLLIGTWKSDERLTLQGCHKYHLLSGQRKRRFRSLFGKLELCFTRARLRYSCNGVEWTAIYEVVAADPESIVLRIHSDDLWKKASPITADILKKLAQPRLEHLHFCRFRGRQYYWVGCGTFCEWFKRIEGRSKGRKPARGIRSTRS